MSTTTLSVAATTARHLEMIVLVSMETAQEELILLLLGIAEAIMITATVYRSMPNRMPSPTRLEYYEEQQPTSAALLPVICVASY